MFSTAQQEIIDTLVPSYLAQGYKSYIVYSQQTTGYNTSTLPDLIFYFSKNNIESVASLYRYSIPVEDSIKIEYRTANFSSSNYGVNTERLVLSDFNGGIINIPVYEHIYTNAVSASVSVQPDIMKGGYQNESLQAQTGNILLCAFLLVFVLLKMWQIHK